MMSRWINWSPTQVEEIAQNVRQLLITAPGTVPLARALGTSQDLVDTPESYAAARLQAECVTAVRTYEPRARISRVRLTANADGVIRARAEIVAP